MTPEQFDNLPGWAQSEFRELKRRLMAEALARKSAADVVTESPVYYTQTVNSAIDGEPVYERRYVQTRAVAVESGGVIVGVSIDSRGRGVSVTALCSDGRAASWTPDEHGRMLIARRT